MLELQLYMRNLIEEARRISQAPAIETDGQPLPSPGVLANRMHARVEIKDLGGVQQLSQDDRSGALLLLSILMKLNRDDIDQVPALAAGLRQRYAMQMRAIQEDTRCSSLLRAAARAMREELERT